MMQKVPGGGGETQGRGEGAAEKARGRRGREREGYSKNLYFQGKYPLKCVLKKMVNERENPSPAEECWAT